MKSALEVLKALNGDASSHDWLTACSRSGIPADTFYKVARGLSEKEYVSKTGRGRKARYRAVDGDADPTATASDCQDAAMAVTLLLTVAATLPPLFRGAVAGSKGWSETRHLRRVGWNQMTCRARMYMLSRSEAERKPKSWLRAGAKG